MAIQKVVRIIKFVIIFYLYYMRLCVYYKDTHINLI